MTGTNPQSFLFRIKISLQRKNVKRGIIFFEKKGLRDENGVRKRYIQENNKVGRVRIPERYTP